MVGEIKERKLSTAWRNAGLGAVAVLVLVLGTQGVLSADDGPVSDAANATLTDCGTGEVARVSEDGYRCE